MRCEVLDVLYVKANGEVLCHDDFGERVSLGWVRDEPTFSVDALRADGPYANIRRSFGQGRVPWPGICENCAFLRPLESGDGLEPPRRWLKTVQVESSLACGLACPGCSQGQQIKARPKPHIMETGVYARLAQSLADEGYEVGAFEFCGQGEPLLNPRVSQMIAHSRSLLPTARHRVITSGNVRYDKTLAGEHVDELFVSVDGVHQRNYEKYRINGDAETALKFMADAKGADPSTALIWKYILFEFNDSDEEIIAAQRRAEALGVDCLMFVVTHSAHRSERYTAENLNELPIVSPIARVNLTPHQKKLERRGEQTGRDIRPKVSFLRPRRAAAHCIVDDLLINSNGTLQAKGWAADRNGRRLRSIDGTVNGAHAAQASLGFARGDVLAAYPSFESDRVGFSFAVPLPPDLRNPHALQLRLTLTGAAGERDEFVADYQFGG